MGINEIATKQDITKMLSEMEQRILQALTGKLGKKDRNLSIDEAVAHIKAKNRSTIYKLTSAGEIPCYKVGKANVYKESDLDRYMVRHRKASNEEIKGKAALRDT